MWIRCNPNPAHKYVGDCVIRAIAVATNRTWLSVFDDLYVTARKNFDMMESNDTWGKYLYGLGFEPFLLPESCPSCITIKEFAKRFPRGTYIIGTGNHAVAVINGDYYDAWDSGDEVPSYFWCVK